MQKIGLSAILITCFLFGIICGGAETNNTDIALKEEIEQRDYNDKTREFSPLVKAVDAVEIDTSLKLNLELI